VSDKTVKALVERSLGGTPITHPSRQELPDLWCFGLAHPYIQRLIFLADIFEKSANNEPDSPL
jgi:hypothetical protein